MIKILFSSVLATALFLSTSLGCQGKDANPEDKSGSASPAQQTSEPTSASPEKPAESNSKVHQIVFIEEEADCPCTGRRVAYIWNQIQVATESDSGIEVIRINQSTDPEKANKYTSMRPLRALPAIYFMDAQGKVVEVLQGMARASEISAIIQR